MCRPVVAERLAARRFGINQCATHTTFWLSVVLVDDAVRLGQDSPRFLLYPLNQDGIIQLLNQARAITIVTTTSKRQYPYFF